MRVPDLVHDVLAADHVAGVCHEHVEQVELLGGKLYRLAVIRDGSRGGIEVDGADVDRTLTRGGMTSAHDGAHAGDQLAGREWLDHVVVSAQLQADDAVDLLPARGEHDDGYVGLGTDQAA